MTSVLHSSSLSTLPYIPDRSLEQISEDFTSSRVVGTYAGGIHTNFLFHDTRVLYWFSNTLLVRDRVNGNASCNVLSCKPDLGFSEDLTSNSSIQFNSDICQVQSFCEEFVLVYTWNHIYIADVRGSGRIVYDTKQTSFSVPFGVSNIAYVDKCVLETYTGTHSCEVFYFIIGCGELISSFSWSRLLGTERGTETKLPLYTSSSGQICRVPGGSVKDKHVFSVECLAECNYHILVGNNSRIFSFYVLMGLTENPAYPLVPHVSRMTMNSETIVKSVSVTVVSTRTSSTHVDNHASYTYKIQGFQVAPVPEVAAMAVHVDHCNAVVRDIVCLEKGVYLLVGVLEGKVLLAQNMQVTNTNAMFLSNYAVLSENIDHNLACKAYVLNASAVAVTTNIGYLFYCLVAPLKSIIRRYNCPVFVHDVQDVSNTNMKNTNTSTSNILQNKDTFPRSIYWHRHLAVLQASFHVLGITSTGVYMQLDYTQSTRIDLHDVSFTSLLRDVLPQLQYTNKQPLPALFHVVRQALNLPITPVQFLQAVNSSKQHSYGSELGILTVRDQKSALVEFGPSAHFRFLLEALVLDQLGLDTIEVMLTSAVKNGQQSLSMFCAMITVLVKDTFTTYVQMTERQDISAFANVGELAARVSKYQGILATAIADYTVLPPSCVDMIPLAYFLATFHAQLIVAGLTYDAHKEGVLTKFCAEQGKSVTTSVLAVCKVTGFNLHQFCPYLLQESFCPAAVYTGVLNQAVLPHVHANTHSVLMQLQRGGILAVQNSALEKSLTALLAVCLQAQHKALVSYILHIIFPHLTQTQIDDTVHFLLFIETFDAIFYAVYNEEEEKLESLLPVLAELPPMPPSEVQNLFWKNTYALVLVLARGVALVHTSVQKNQPVLLASALNLVNVTACSILPLVLQQKLHFNTHAVLPPVFFGLLTHALLLCGHLTKAVGFLSDFVFLLQSEATKIPANIMQVFVESVAFGSYALALHSLPVSEQSNKYYSMNHTLQQSTNPKALCPVFLHTQLQFLQSDEPTLQNLDEQFCTFYQTYMVLLQGQTLSSVIPSRIDRALSVQVSLEHVSITYLQKVYLYAKQLTYTPSITSSFLSSKPLSIASPLKPRFQAKPASSTPGYSALLSQRTQSRVPHTNVTGTPMTAVKYLLSETKKPRSLGVMSTKENLPSQSCLAIVEKYLTHHNVFLSVSHSSVPVQTLRQQLNALALDESKENAGEVIAAILSKIAKGASKSQSSSDIRSIPLDFDESIDIGKKHPQCVCEGVKLFSCQQHVTNTKVWKVLYASFGEQEDLELRRDIDFTEENIILLEDVEDEWFLHENNVELQIFPIFHELMQPPVSPVSEMRVEHASADSSHTDMNVDPNTVSPLPSQDDDEEEEYSDHNETYDEDDVNIPNTSTNETNPTNESIESIQSGGFSWWDSENSNEHDMSMHNEEDSHNLSHNPLSIEETVYPAEMRLEEVAENADASDDMSFVSVGQQSRSVSMDEKASIPLPRHDLLLGDFLMTGNAEVSGDIDVIDFVPVSAAYCENSHIEANKQSNDNDEEFVDMDVIIDDINEKVTDEDKINHDDLMNEEDGINKEDILTNDDLMNEEDDMNKKDILTNDDTVSEEDDIIGDLPLTNNTSTDLPVINVLAALEKYAQEMHEEVQPKKRATRSSSMNRNTTDNKPLFSPRRTRSKSQQVSQFVESASESEVEHTEPKPKKTRGTTSVKKQRTAVVKEEEEQVTKEVAETTVPTTRRKKLDIIEEVIAEVVAPTRATRNKKNTEDPTNLMQMLETFESAATATTKRTRTNSRQPPPTTETVPTTNTRRSARLAASQDPSR